MPSPNIILIVSDDQRADTLQYMPGLQSLLVNGVNFTNAYVTTPLCASARASILVGNSANYTGVKTNLAPYGGATIMDHSYTIASVLKFLGYTTGFFGKYNNEYHKLLPPWTETPFVPPYWDDWRAFDYNSTDFWNYGMVENGILVPHVNDYSTDRIRDLAINFITNATQPFFTMFCPAGPHTPASPATRHAGSFANWGPYRPVSYQEADISEKQPHIHAAKNAWTSSTAATLDTFQRSQLETLQAIDEAIVALFNASPSNTVLIFVSDNGLTWGEHWLTGTKRMAYEEQIRVPLVIVGPPNLVVPHTESRIALNIDIKPTIEYLAGGVPAGEGRSLKNVLKNLSTPAWRTDFLCQGWNLESVYNPHTFEAVVSPSWKYIKNISPTNIVSEELYDLTTDPWEMSDLKSSNPTKLAEMRARLQQLVAQYQ